MHANQFDSLALGPSIWASPPADFPGGSLADVRLSTTDCTGPSVLHLGTMRGFNRIMDAFNKAAALINLPILHDMGRCDELLVLWIVRTGCNHYYCPSNALGSLPTGTNMLREI